MIREIINFKYKYGRTKRKTSVSKKNERSHHKIANTNIVEDKKTGEYKLSHHIDLKSGFTTVKNLRYLKSMSKRYYCN